MTQTTMNLSPLQKQRIELILDEDMPSSYNEETSTYIWNHWTERFNVIFYQLENGDYVVLDREDKPITNGELNRILTSIIESLTRNKNTTIRVKSTEKIKSVTTSVNNPNPASLEKYIQKLDPKVPLGVLKDIYNKASQEMEDEMFGKPMEEALAHVHYLRFRADRAQEIYDRIFRKTEKHIRIKINEVRTDSKTRRTKPEPKLAKVDKKIIEKNLSPIQVMMKAAGLDYTNKAEVLAYEKRYRDAMGLSDEEFKIESVSTELRSFGSKSKDKK